MLKIHWDVVIVGGILTLMIAYLAVQFLIGFDAGQLFEAWRTARSDAARDRSNRVQDARGKSQRSISTRRRRAS